LEDLAAGARLENAFTFLEKLEMIAEKLIGQIDALTIESLQKQAGTRNDLDRRGC